MSVYEHMRPGDVRVFQEAARFFQVWIVVRRTNSASLPYIGKPGYVPKRMDCKAKTADRDVALPRVGLKRVGGLVVDPTLPGMEQAFRSPSKLAEARQSWEQFKHKVYFPDPSRPLAYFPNGKLYSVQMNPEHPHYGCVLLSSSSLASAASYVHGDYDLFGIIPAQEPAANVRVTEERLGLMHARGRDFFDVQHFVNRRMGVPMVLHGEAEKFGGHTQETLDVFWPNGDVTESHGSQQLYETVFGGRKPFAPGVKGQPLFGRWRKI